MENQEMAEYTHIISVKGQENAYFASDFIDGATTVSFTTTSKKGEKWGHEINKSEISEIKRKLA